MKHRFIKWFTFGVAFALAPLLGDYLTNSLHVTTSSSAAINTVTPTSLRLTDVILKGELLLVAAGIAGAAVGELIGSSKNWLSFKFIAGGCCIILLLLVSQLYATTANNIRMEVSYNTEILVENSIWLFIFTLVAGAGCILIAEENRWNQ